MSDALPSGPDHERLLPTPEETVLIDAQVAAREADPTRAVPEVAWRDPGPDPFGQDWSWMHGPGPDGADGGPDVVDGSVPPG